MGQQFLSSKAMFGFLIVIIMTFFLCTSVYGDDQKDQSSITGLGIRKFLSSSIMGILNGSSTTTTTTAKPNLIDRAQSFFRDTKDKSQIILDPKKALENKINEKISEKVKEILG